MTTICKKCKQEVHSGNELSLGKKYLIKDRISEDYLREVTVCKIIDGYIKLSEICNHDTNRTSYNWYTVTEFNKRHVVVTELK